MTEPAHQKGFEAALRCNNCRALLPTEVVNARAQQCPSCRTSVRVQAYPALLRRDLGPAPIKRVADANDSACYYHDNRRAERECTSCGRFVCALCDIELGEDTLCPSCLERHMKDKSLARLDFGRTRWDRVNTSLAAFGLLSFSCIPIVFITAPAAIGIAIKHRATPLSIFPRSRAGLWLGAGAAALELVAYVGFIGLMLFGAIRDF
jgi:hypothetical protein